MLALLSALLLLAAADLTKIFEDGAFDRSASLANPKIKEGADGKKTMLVYFYTPRCLQSFHVRTTEDTPAIVQTVVGHNKGTYIWETIGSTVLTSDNEEIPIEDAPHCVSRFQITIEKGSFKAVYADAELLEEREKRQGTITCTFNMNSQWPNTCKSSSAGTKCLQSSGTTGTCGCEDDGDCYADVSHPFCDIAGSSGTAKTCVKCTNVPGANGDLFKSGYACRGRYPSKYYADASLMTGTQSPGFVAIQNNPGEQIPTDSFFKELCITGDNSGACERCDQASDVNIPDNDLSFPDYSSTTSDVGLSDALRGSFFCRAAYGSNGPTGRIQRPICISSGGFSAIGLSTVFTDYRLTMEIGYFGSGTPSTVQTGTDPAKPNVDVTRTVAEWEGACGPCVLSPPTGTTTLRVHTLCSKTFPKTPICDASIQLGCRACSSNAECSVETSPTACLTDGSGSCTGGKNCQADGSCKSCTSDADCGLKDGPPGAGGQAKCNVATGQCEDAFSCLGNLNEGTTKDCTAANGGNNCQADGSCKTCTSNADCGSLDGVGGSKSGQQVCDVASGTCKGCTLNSQCVGTSGANCQKDGTCLDCTSSLTCGLLDGGVGSCTNSASSYCADLNDQPICNTATKICESQCLSNQWCSLKKAAQTTSTNNGANCGLDGVCYDCQTPGAASPIPNSPNCGLKDGPPVGLAGRSGTEGQTQCDTSGICVSPFSCTSNANCAQSGTVFTCSAVGSSCANCQVSGSCVPCTVTRSSSTCDSQDGPPPLGEQPSQVNCQQSTRQCVDRCTDGTNNNDCKDTQGANCMESGLCISCQDDTDCKVGNSWGGDKGGSTVCNTVTGICIAACTANDLVNRLNCMKDGRLKACANNAECVSSDGPPPMGSDIICNNGICTPPFQCSNASTPADNDGCKANGAGNNCMADKTCFTCTKDSDCINDGGFKPGQPKCNTQTGVCVDCGSNADCLGTGTPLNCDADGLCRDCRKYPGSQSCSSQDGPPSTPKRNPNCDSLTGICVDFCTKDADCLDTCNPKCQLERGCCVECLAPTDCPVAQWRGAQKAFTYCSQDYMCTLPPPPPPEDTVYVCQTDSDCNNSTGNPACDFARQVCVECTADAHCPSGSPACHIGSRQCVDCTDDTYCVNDLDEDGNSKQCSSLNTCESDAGESKFGGALFLGLVVLIARIF